MYILLPIYLSDHGTFDLLYVSHVIVHRSWRHHVRHVGAHVHFDDLTDRRRRWRMVRRWKPVSAVQRVHVLLASVSFRGQDGRLHLHVQVRRTVKVSVKIGTTAQSTEESHSRVQLRTNPASSIGIDDFSFLFSFLFFFFSE